MARARYLILSTDDMENDELLEKMENTPTFRRDPKFKSTIKAMQNSALPKPGAQGAATPKRAHEINFEND